MRAFYETIFDSGTSKDKRTDKKKHMMTKLYVIYYSILVLIIVNDQILQTEYFHCKDSDLLFITHGAV